MSDLIKRLMELMQRVDSVNAITGKEILTTEEYQAVDEAITALQQQEAKDALLQEAVEVLEDINKRGRVSSWALVNRVITKIKEQSHE